MRLLLRFLALIVFLLPVRPVLAWAPLGHQTVAAIAARQLTPLAHARIAALLGGDAGTMMILDSSWADEVRDQRPETAPWHFVNIELGSSGYVAARDCPADDCVVAQINRDTAILSDPKAPRIAKVEALRFLIHFVGDVHQPLHAADRHDKGGNDVKTVLRGRRTSLHQIWDQDIVTALGDDPMSIALRCDALLTPQQKKQWAGGAPADWANESFALAGREIYAGLPSEGRIHLPNDYAVRESGVARIQLTKAGLRLGALLNRIFG